MGRNLEQHYNYQERKNPLIKVARLINQYWSIDLMEATKAEKDWAKKRLHNTIMHISKDLGNGANTTIKMSLKSKEFWETSRNSFF